MFYAYHYRDVMELLYIYGTNKGWKGYQGVLQNTYHDGHI